MATKKKVSKKSKPANEKPIPEEEPVADEPALDLEASEDEIVTEPRQAPPVIEPPPSIASGGRTPQKGEYVLRVRGDQFGDPYANRILAIRAGQKHVADKVCGSNDVAVTEAV